MEGNCTMDEFINSIPPIPEFTDDQHHALEGLACAASYVLKALVVACPGGPSKLIERGMDEVEVKLVIQSGEIVRYWQKHYLDHRPMPQGDNDATEAR